MKSQITDRACAGKCPWRGARGLTYASPAAALEDSRPSCARRLARASSPAPLPARARNSRREEYRGCGGAKNREMPSIAQGPAGMHSLFDVYKLIQTQQHLAEIGQGQIARVGLAGRLIG